MGDSVYEVKDEVTQVAVGHGHCFLCSVWVVRQGCVDVHAAPGRARACRVGVSAGSVLGPPWEGDGPLPAGGSTSLRVGSCLQARGPFPGLSGGAPAWKDVPRMAMPRLTQQPQTSHTKHSISQGFPRSCNPRTHEFMR